MSKYGADSALLWHCYYKVWKSVKIRRWLRCSLKLLHQSMEECQNTALTPLFFDTVIPKYGRVSKYGTDSAVLWHCSTKVWKSVNIRRSLRCSLTLLHQSMEEYQNTALTPLFFDNIIPTYRRVSKYGAHSAVLWHCYTKVWKSVKIWRSLRCSLTMLYQNTEACQNTALTPTTLYVLCRKKKKKKKKKETSQSHHQTFRLNKFSALYTQKPVRWKTDPWVYCPAGF